jgi:fatty-acyl-CoA synthase
VPNPLPTIADRIRERADDDRPALRFEDRVVPYREYAAECGARANWLIAQRRPGPFHVGVLLDNVPEYPFLLGAAALAGAAIVGINPTRRGAELARDIAHADCQLLVTESRHAPLLEHLALGVHAERRFCCDDESWERALAPHRGRALPQLEIDPRAPYLLLFTSGTTGDPKAAICSQARLAGIGTNLSAMRKFSPATVAYLAMPMFHSNALMAGWAPILTCGGTGVLRRRFSASGFLPDVRRYGVTYFNYVGKPLTYILATPERPDDADNPLELAFGNEGAEHDLERFAKRFGCQVIDGYGSTEGGLSISRTPDTPPGSLGVGPPGTEILDPETGRERPRARFDANGRLVNAEECVGEIANRQTAPTFEGYWRNADANRERTRDGIYWSGDLGYRDERGFFYFAGRNFDWLRVDGENFAAAPIERILVRHPSVALAAVYAVPNPEVGDDVMAALILRPACELDFAEFARFLGAQSDLGTKWAPRYVRVARELPLTESNKIVKRALRAERWNCADPVYCRAAGSSYQRMTAADIEALHAAFRARNRGAVLDT